MASTYLKDETGTTYRLEIDFMSAGNDKETPKVEQNQHHHDDSARKEKRPYSLPALIKWGTLQDMTKQVGFQGSSDGGRLVFRRTRW